MGFLKDWAYGAVLGVCIAAGLGGAVQGEALSPAGAEDGGWRFVVTPYLFLPVATTGTSTVDGIEADVDLSLGDVLEILQGAASARGEAWRGNYGIISEFYYTQIEDDATLPLSGGGETEITANTKQGWVSLLGAYRIAEGVRAGNRRWAVDVSGGARWNSLRQEVDVDGDAPLSPGLPASFGLGGTETWWEPVVGLRGAWEVADRWTLGARVDLGGFGAGGSDLQYLVLAGADWRPWERTSVKLGWQFYGLDFSRSRDGGRFAYDVDQNGPYLGLSFRF